MRICESLKEFSNKICETRIKAPLMYYGKTRKLNIIHSQFRLQCSDLNSDLYHLHVINNATCICSDKIEDAIHFFFDCPLYREARAQMLNQFALLYPQLIVNIDVLLYGSEFLSKYDNVKIAKIVETYIFESGRFRL